MICLMTASKQTVAINSGLEAKFLSFCNPNLFVCLFGEWSVEDQKNIME